MASTAGAHARCLALDGLPPEVLGRIVSWLPPRGIASLNATARLFLAAPPGGCSPVERALRERACARGHARALPVSLPPGVRTWTEELFARERTLALARAHAAAVDSGNGFSAFVDAEGGLHTCGEEEEADHHGVPTGEYSARLALGHDGDATVPTRVPSLSSVRVVAVAAGWAHLLALSDAGAVYGCGQNRRGQLGLGDTVERRSFAPVDAMRREAVVGIAAGFHRSLALAAAGCAYSWGCNGYGQLGHGDTKERRQPTRFEALEGVRVGGVSAGAVTTLLLSTGGAVYSCGIGRSGRLGHGDEQHQHTPKRIEALAGVCAVHVSAGHMHSLVVDGGVGVHSFGGGYAGCLGHEDKRSQLLPKRVEALRATVHAVRAYAGRKGSAVLAADGTVHAVGDNS